MVKILFVIHDLSVGGAEKVLVNLVNNMDTEKFDITVLALFGGGVNAQFLAPHIHYQTVFPRAFPGNSHLMKLLSPRQLHRLFIRERFDIEVSYLEGPSARIVSGCPAADTRLVSWIHCTVQESKLLSTGFRSCKEAITCYNRMNAMCFVSEAVEKAFLRVCPYNGQTYVRYNTNESKKILSRSAEPVDLPEDVLRWCGVGKLVELKGFDRMLRIQKKLRDAGLNTHLYILGKGPDRDSLEALANQLGISGTVTFLGYQTNPYKYVAGCDLFVCASHAEGFSTAATEALILGVPVCTVEVSGMREMLGANDEYGVVVPNDEEALYQGIRRLLADPDLLQHYRQQAAIRGQAFRTEETVRAVEEMLEAL